MIVLLNGPLGIGKSTLGEALVERIEGCVFLEGDALVALNPAPEDEREHLHSTIALLVAHNLRAGYRHFVVDHLWTSADALSDLRRRLAEVAPSSEVRVFLLTLPEDENLRRIERRATAREIDERDFERTTVVDERRRLASARGDELGEPFSVADPPSVLARHLIVALGL